MNVLITGATGFVGSHLIEYIQQHEGATIYGAKRRRSDMQQVETVKGRVEWVEMDITDAHSVRAVLKEVQPERIFHLAAQSFVPTSWRSPQETFSVNAIGTVNVLEAARDLDLCTRVHVAGSSEEYGLVRLEETPITEDNPLRPQSPYGVSKVAADLFCQQYHRSYGIHVVVTRAFNHTGPRRGEVFATSNFAKQIVEIEKGIRSPVIYVGNLDTMRDFTDVRNTVWAYWLALEKGKAGEVYNICSEKAISMQEMLDQLLELSTVDKGEITVTADPKRMRPSDVPLLLGNCSKFKQQTGWTCTIPFEQTLNDLLDYWRKRLVG